MRVFYVILFAEYQLVFTNKVSLGCLICREQTPSVLKSILEEWKRLTSTVNEVSNTCTSLAPVQLQNTIRFIKSLDHEY